MVRPLVDLSKVCLQFSFTSHVSSCSPLRLNKKFSQISLQKRGEAERCCLSKKFKIRSIFYNFFVSLTFFCAQNVFDSFRRRPSPSDTGNWILLPSPGRELQKYGICGLQIGRDQKISCRAILFHPEQIPVLQQPCIFTPLPTNFLHNTSPPSWHQRIATKWSKWSFTLNWITLTITLLCL